MAGFFNRFLGREDDSAIVAKERMKLVLIHDRTDFSPGKLEKLKDELIDVISKHVDIDPNAVRIEVAYEGREQRLIADIPLRTTHKRRYG